MNLPFWIRYVCKQRRQWKQKDDFFVIDMKDAGIENQDGVC